MRKDIYKDGVNTRFKKGKSGNPKGKPKGIRNFKTIIDEYLRKNVKLENPLKNGKKERLGTKEHLITRLIAKGLNGNLKAIEDLKEWSEGKTKQEFALSGELKNTNVQEMSPDQLKLLEDNLKDILYVKLKYKKNE